MDIAGWDFVCACKVDRLNALLAAQFTPTPATISYTDAAGTTLSLTFAAWEIAPGGTANKLMMKMPIQTGSVSSALAVGDLSGAVALVVVELDFFTDAAGSKSDLKFNFAAAANGPNDTTKGCIYVSNADATGVLAARDPSLVTQLHDAIAACLIHNQSKLDFLLSTLNHTPTGDGSWLAPTHMAYSYIDGAGGTAGHLAVLSVLTDRPIAALSTQVDTSLFDPACDVFAAFAGEMFLEHMVMPQLPAAFPGAQATDFICANGMIINLPMSFLTCAPVKVGLINYYPVIVAFSLRIKGNLLSSTGIGAFDITGLAQSSVSFSETQDSACVFDTAAQQISFAASGTPTTDYEKHIPVWLYIVAAPAILAFGPLIGGIVVAIVDGVVAGVSTAVAKATTGSGTNLAIGGWTSRAVTWPGSGTWKIEDAGLQDVFYLHCNI